MSLKDCKTNDVVILSIDGKESSVKVVSVRGNGIRVMGRGELYIFNKSTGFLRGDGKVNSSKINIRLMEDEL